MRLILCITEASFKQVCIQLGLESVLTLVGIEKNDVCLTQLNAEAL